MGGELGAWEGQSFPKKIQQQPDLYEVSWKQEQFPVTTVVFFLG